MTNITQPKLFAKVVHVLRLFFEPDHNGLIANQPKRWQVLYNDGVSIPMGYRMACGYAEMYGGTVQRYVKKAKS